MKRKPNVAVVGATGVVGSTFLKVLEERDFPFENIYMMASAKSAGKKVMFKGKEYTVEELTEHSFDKPIDIALFSAGGSTSEKFAPIAAAHGAVVVDNSSQWRMDKNVPLVVPEVNPEDIKWNKGIIANPNCSTIQAMVALKPLQDLSLIHISSLPLTDFRPSAISSAVSSLTAPYFSRVSSFTPSSCTFASLL